MTDMYVCPDCLCTRDTYCDDPCECHGPQVIGPISKAALTELVETNARYRQYPFADVLAATRDTP